MIETKILQGSCQDDSCRQTQTRLGNEIEKLKQKVKKSELENKNYKQDTTKFKLQLYYAKGLETSDLLDKVDKAFNFRGHNLLS